MGNSVALERIKYINDYHEVLENSGQKKKTIKI